MFVLKEKLINSILIKAKGEGCVLYSYWIPLPLNKGGKKKEKPLWCVLRPFHSPHRPFTFIWFSWAGDVWEQAAEPGRGAALHGCPHLHAWSLDLELDPGCSHNHSLTVSLHFKGL